MKKISKLLIISVLFVTAAMPAAAQLNSKAVHILCYHAFLERSDPYSFTNKQFKDQLEQLKNNGFKFVTFEDIINDRISGSNNILVSIDDGNKSVYQAYFEVLKPMGIKPLLGIYPAIISKTNYAMTWDQLKALSDEGCYIASHGYHHMFLTEKYYNSDQAGFKKEIYLSKKILEEKLNRTIETMVYPFGAFSDIAISELKNAGFKYGMTIVPKIQGIPIHDSFQINRYLMTKPAQKGIIAKISKQFVNDQIAGKEQFPERNDVTSVMPNKVVKKSIIHYPERIKQIITEDAFVIKQEEIKPQNTSLNIKSNPFSYKPETSAQLKKNKKAGTEKKAVKKRENRQANLNTKPKPLAHKPEASGQPKKSKNDEIEKKNLKRKRA